MLWPLGGCWFNGLHTTTLGRHQQGPLLLQLAVAYVESNWSQHALLMCAPP